MRDSLAIISNAIDRIITVGESPPGLSELARQAGYDPSYFQKLFQDHVGMSPAKLSRYLKYRHARDLLFTRGVTTLDASYESGLSGQGRLHDLMIDFEAATPGEVRNKGKGLVIRYAILPSIFGDVFLAMTPRGLCWLGFENVPDHTCDKGLSLERCRSKWPFAEFVEAPSSLTPVRDKLNTLLDSKPDARIKLHVFGTNFQVQVWQALMRIPAGTAVSYGAIAVAMDKPSASRAVGSAVGDNPVSLLIPCHRVIQSSGIVENYGWGDARKKFLLARENAALC